MKKAWVLSKLYINSLYGFSGFARDLKNDRKKAMKALGFLLLIMASMSGTVTMFVALNVKMYDLLKPIHQQGMILTMMVLMATLMTFVFGLTGIVATYFVDKEGDIILSMPIKAWHMLVAKFSSNYIYEAVLSLFLMGTGFVVYGVKSSSGPLFYLVSIVISLLVPVFPLVLGYFLVIPMMRAGSILRKKDFTMVLTMVIVLVFALGIQYMSQMMIKLDTNPQAIVETLASENGLVTYAGNIYFPSIWATFAMTDFLSIKGLVDFLVFAFISVATAVLLIVAMSGVYAVSIEGSQEVTKKRKFTSGEFKQNLKKTGSFKALLSREIKMMNREPVFFLNGPLIILLLPVIMGFMFYLRWNEFGPQLAKFTAMSNAEYYSTLLIAAVSVFMAVSINITSSAISREGRAFEAIKALPIKVSEYILAKLAHGMIFGIFAAFICSILGFALLKLSLLNLLLAFVISILIMLPIQIAGLLMELTWPKLVWDNPQKAMKQNVNGLVIILGSMTLLPLLGFAIYKFTPAPLYVYSGLILLALVAALAAYKLLMGYGVKQFYNLEV